MKNESLYTKKYKRRGKALVACDRNALQRHKAKQAKHRDLEDRINTLEQRLLTLENLINRSNDK